MGFTGLLWALLVPVVSAYAMLHFKDLLTLLGCSTRFSPVFSGERNVSTIGVHFEVHTTGCYFCLVCMLLYKGRFYICGCGLGYIPGCSGRKVHKIDPYMMVCMLLYEGQFYVCGCGFGTSLADCFGRRVHMVTYYEG